MSVRATRTRPLLQRDCGCAGSCDDCAKKKTLRRSALAPRTPAKAPAIVHDVLRSAGEPLDASTRAFMEPRFGRDFSGVRVHRDAEAARSAAAVQARAYTVGSHIVFAETPSRATLAHELAHTIQQSPAHAGELQIGAADHPLEHEADSIAGAVLRGGAAGAATATDPFLRRQPEDAAVPPPIAGVPEREPAEAAPAPDAGVSDEKPATPTEFAGLPIGDARTKMEAEAKKAGGGAETLAVDAGARFVLHDTSSESTAGRLTELAGLNRGPLGEGIAAYVPRAGSPTLGRPSFFEAHRPTATEFEKDLEFFHEKGDVTDKIDATTTEALLNTWATRRDARFRKVFGLTDPAKANAIIDETLAVQKLTTDEIKKERAGEGKKKAPLAAQLTDPTKKVFTAGAFGIEAICQKASDKDGAASIAAKGQETALQTECLSLAPYFAERNKRVQSSVNVEIVQPGVNEALMKKDAATLEKIANEKKAAAAADPKDAKPAAKEDPAAAAERAAVEKRAAYKSPKNTCDIKNPYVLAFAREPYSQSQYDAVRALYFRAALTAGYYPKITTHKETDGGAAHCDPRCFKLTTFYNDTAAILGHAKGSTYGITPKYGVSHAANVWWHEPFCHGAPPQ